MDSIKNIVEYYDELYPVTQEQYEFYDSLLNVFPKPVKFLNIGCGTGILENRLAKDITDVTGLETIKELLESAARKHRNQLMAVRFFQMSTIEMVRFLGKSFYNVISCLNNRIIFIHDKVLLRKFFFDCRQLLKPDGMVILQLYNYDLYIQKPSSILPELSSIRATLKSKLECAGEEEYYLTQNIETGNGRTVSVCSKASVYPIRRNEIEAFAREAGFTSVEYYSDYKKTPVNDQSPNLVVIVK